MYHRILIPLDGSPLAEQVLPLAKMLTARLKSSVVLFQAIPPIQDTLRAEGEAFQADEQIELLRWQAREYLETIHKDLATADIAAEREVRVGAPATAILEYAESAAVDLIAMATHGRTGVQRWAYGSVADKVLRGARVSVLLVRTNETPLAPTTLTRILVPLDGSALAENALEPARQLAAIFDAELLLFRVPEVVLYGMQDPVALIVELEQQVRADAEGYLAEVKRRVQDQGVRVRTEIRMGSVADDILETVQSDKADLIVMSTHGRSGISRWIMGSVADRVLSASPVPVLLIRPLHAGK